MAYFLEWRNLNKENCIEQVSCWPFKKVYLNQPDIRKRADALIDWINRILEQKNFQIEIPKFHPLLCICEWFSGLCNSLNQNICLTSLIRFPASCHFRRIKYLNLSVSNVNISITVCWQNIMISTSFSTRFPS